MKREVPILPFVDGTPSEVHQQRIVWVINGESTTGSNSSYRPDGTLNRVPWQLYQNIVFLKNLIDEREETYNVVLEKVESYEENNIYMMNAINLMDTTLTSMMYQMDNFSVIVENVGDDVKDSKERVELLDERVADLDDALGLLIFENEEEHAELMDDIIFLESKFEDYYTSEEVDVLLEELPTKEDLQDIVDIIPDSYTKTESDQKFETKDNLVIEFAKYATKEDLSDVEGLIPDSYTKNESDTKYAVKVEVYTKTEIDTKLEEIAPETIDAYTKNESNNLFSTKTEVAEKITEVEGKIPNSYTKTESDGKYITTVKLGDYYTKTETGTKFALKTEIVDAYPKTHTLSSVQIENTYATKANLSAFHYTKHDTDTKFALKTDIKPQVDAYTKVESDNKYALKADIKPQVDAYTKVESDNKYATKTLLEADYYTSGYIDVEFTRRIELADYALTTNVYSKNNANDMFVSKTVYTSEIAGLLARIEALEGTGGE